MTMLRYANGKITQEIVHYDTATLTAQAETSAVPQVAD